MVAEIRPEAMRNVPSGEIAVPVWDWPVRLTHWALVLLVTVSWVTGKYGLLDWHRYSGYAALGLVLFRIYWGFAGSSTARFSHFIQGPSAVWQHSRTLLKRSGSKMAGHTPLGGWSILAMLSVLLIQSGLGLFTVDVDGLESGPLSDLVSFETGRYIAGWHGTLVNVLALLIALHLAAILHYWLYKRENLVAPMLTGLKRLPPEMAFKPSMGTFWRALIGLVVVALVVAGLITRFRV